MDASSFVNSKGKIVNKDIRKALARSAYILKKITAAAKSGSKKEQPPK